MKKSIILLILIVSSIMLTSCTSTPIGQKLKQCPDIWYDDQMPRIAGDDTPSQYLVIDDKRREVSEFDMEWIKENCNITPTRLS